jgi:hypothetical protein
VSFIVAPIVEGHGDVQAVPVLLRKIDPTIQIARAVRFPRSKLIKPEELLRAAAIAAANIVDRGAILLLIDADDDCAARLGPELEGYLNARFPNHLCRVVLAVQEFEAWIVGGDEAYGIENADEIGRLKGRIEERNGGVYKETVDQTRLIAVADLVRVRQRSRSFRRLVKIVEEFTAAANL